MFRALLFKIRSLYRDEAARLNSKTALEEAGRERTSKAAAYMMARFERASDPQLSSPEKGRHDPDDPILEEMKQEMTDGFQEYERARLEYRSVLQREDLEAAERLGIDIPESKFDPDLNTKALSERGHAWLRRELKSVRRQTIEFYAKIILPTFSLIVALAAFLYTYRKESDSKPLTPPPCTSVSPTSTSSPVPSTPSRK
jgi:hypothetical protein